MVRLVLTHPLRHKHPCYSIWPGLKQGRNNCPRDNGERNYPVYSFFTEGYFHGMLEESRRAYVKGVAHIHPLRCLFPDTSECITRKERQAHAFLEECIRSHDSKRP